ncbi:MAG: hypothetical protein U1F61_08835 [Opitutaceae bacterium]|jgi:hypothetical protein
MPDNSPTSPAPARPSSTALLQRLMETGDACFADIHRHGHITPTNGRAYRRAKAEARMAIAVEAPRLPTMPGLRP